MKNRFKNWLVVSLNKVFKNADLKHGNNFDLDRHLAAYNFVVYSDKNNIKIYTNNRVSILINNDKKTFQIINKTELINKLNFIPNSPLILDIIITMTLNNLHETVL
jgi:hypothetical protein